MTGLLQTIYQLKKCACGCGESISDFDARGRPHRFISGHNRYLSNWTDGLTPVKTGTKYCDCGCGKKIPSVTKDGKVMKFAAGHYHNKPLGERYKHYRGYWWVKTKDGWRQEHRVIIEKMIRRPLRSYEDVHHINGNKGDNRIENLEVIRHGDHSSLHNDGMFKGRRS